jgi:FKBP-type peptidyl-prolyl cis-trans isomerase 2
VVTLSYMLRDTEGVPLEDPPGPYRLEVVFGSGKLPLGIERAIDGAGVGARLSLVLSPEEAFGPRRPEAVLEVDRTELPPDVAPGDQFEAENEEGRPVCLRVLEVGSEVVRVDANHPLAGQKISVELEVLDVRPASTHELAAVTAHLGASAAYEPLIPAERLLRGTARRYDSAPTEADASAPDREQATPEAPGKKA